MLTDVNPKLPMRDKMLTKAYEISTCRKFRQVRREGDREVEREIDHYNLDVIISVGYRVKSAQGTQFRIWATQRLKEYIIKGFALNDERFKSGSSMNYLLNYRSASARSVCQSGFSIRKSKTFTPPASTTTRRIKKRSTSLRLFRTSCFGPSSKYNAL